MELLHGVIFYVASLALYPEWGKDIRALIALAVVAIPAGFEFAKKIKDLVVEKEKTPALAGVSIQTTGQEGSKFAAPVILQPGSTLVAHDQIIQQLPPEPVYHPLHQLPSPPSDFTGRERELKQLLAAVESGNVKIGALQGMGGVGKTALALALADRIKERCPDAQIFLDLKGAPEPNQTALAPEEALQHVILSFQPGVKLPGDLGSLLAVYRSVLAGKRALLLFDNAKMPPSSKT